MRTTIVFLLAAFALTSCWTGTDLYDRVQIAHPTVTLSSTSVAVGDYVEVHMTTTLQLDHRSRVAEQTGEVEMGICFNPDWLEGNQTDNCDVHENRIRFTPSDDFTLAEGNTASVLLPITIHRGETLVINHTFSIAAQRPGTVRFDAALESYADGPWGRLYCVTGCPSVTWD